jgi:transcriptional regulator with XRE-family HTH domain
VFSDIKKAIIHLDNIRIQKKMTVEELCDGICGDRQYRKYVKGDTNISEKRLMEFVNKLGISARDFYYSLYDKDRYDFNDIKNLYIQLEQKDFSEFNTKLDVLSKLEGLSSHNQRFLSFIRTKYLLDKKEILESTAIAQLSKICEYPSCLKMNVFDFVDIISLHLIAQLEYKCGKTDSVDLLLRILKDRSIMYITSETESMLPSIYSNVSIILGRLGRIEAWVSLATEGIDFCLKNDYGKSLTRLYYSLSMAHKQLNNGTLAEHYAALCYSNAIARNNPNEAQQFFKLLEKDFHKDPFRMIVESKDKILTKKAE